MSELQPLRKITFTAKPVPAGEIGARGVLKWLPLTSLFIDPNYQRGVLGAGERNVKRMIEEFHWTLFSPLVVAERGNGKYAIIDGQHRAIAACQHGKLTELPCLVMRGSVEDEARAFSVINGNVTRLHRLHVYRARLASGDKQARTIDRICKGLNIIVMPYPKADLAHNETLAIGTIEQCVRLYGAEGTTEALSCLVAAIGQSKGLLVKAAIQGICMALHEQPNWKNRTEAVADAMRARGVSAMLKEAWTRSAQSGLREYTNFAAVMRETLTSALGDGGYEKRPRNVRTRESGDKTGRRFTGKPQHEPESLRHLASGHPALSESRTLFPSSVVDPEDSERLLISGANSVKLGKKVLKGEWTGFPIFQLSLEERATCPKSCHVLEKCYGNAMPFARRHRHGPKLVEYLHAELVDLQDEHPEGFVVRLHVLGDFYDLPYVHAWARFLDEFPALHIFGYTAWDRKTSNIGHALYELSQSQWSRFAMRFSSDQSLLQGATTIWRKPEGPTVAEGIMCPAQSDQTACCATCGLCWSKGAKDKTIVFIGHGGIGNGGRKPSDAKVLQSTFPKPVTVTVQPRSAPRISRKVFQPTGQAKELIDYLAGAGVDVEAISNTKFRYGGAHIGFEELIERANRRRMIDGLPKLKVVA